MISRLFTLWEEHGKKEKKEARPSLSCCLFSFCKYVSAGEHMDAEAAYCMKWANRLLTEKLNTSTK